MKRKMLTTESYTMARITAHRMTEMEQLLTDAELAKIASQYSVDTPVTSIGTTRKKTGFVQQVITLVTRATR